MDVLDQIQSDTRDAMKAGERDRVGALRMIADALQKERKQGGDDAVAVLRRERKRRLEAAEAYRDGGSPERADAEEAEAREIERYMPAELSDEELGELVDSAISDTGASAPGDMGKVMGAVMPKVGGRADGKRVSATVRERLAS
ncbi:MAG TPA: GatB/YqeY domain-containing protein [Solirubrobacterales bacterium]|nr:GatB/YqeY domain-containing protein [Solirubrobacterales bacterium]